MTKKVNVAIVQRSGAGTTDENLREMSRLVEEAVKSFPHLDVIVFPEYCYFAPTTMEESKKVAEEIPDYDLMMTPDEKRQTIAQLKEQMLAAVRKLEFEKAAVLRDKIAELEK